MSPRGGVPKRKVTRDAVRPRLRIFTEGTTEEQYLKQWGRVHHRTVIVEVDPDRGDPFSLVERASDVVKRDRAAAKRGRQPDYVSGGVWCVFDRDEHRKLPEAFEMARANGVRIAFTDPCLELWFLIHFVDQTAWLHRDEAQSRCVEILGCGKNLSPGALDRLVAAHPTAVERAQRLTARHVGNGNPPNDNPSSSVWELVEMIRKPPAPAPVHRRGG